MVAGLSPVIQGQRWQVEFGAGRDRAVNTIQVVPARLFREMKEGRQAESAIGKGIPETTGIFRRQICDILHVAALGYRGISRGIGIPTLARSKLEYTRRIIDALIFEAEYLAHRLADRIRTGITRCRQTGEGDQLVAVGGDIEARRPSESIRLDIDRTDGDFQTLILDCRIQVLYYVGKARLPPSRIMYQLVTRPAPVPGNIRQHPVVKKSEIQALVQRPLGSPAIVGIVGIHRNITARALEQRS